MSEDVFGNLGDLPDFVSDEAPAAVEPEAPVAEAPAESIVEEAPAPVVEQPVAEQPVATEAAPVEETPEEAAERLLAGKYKSVEDLEKGYRELRDLQRRTAERAKQADIQRQELEARSRQIQDALQQTIPAVQQALSQRQQQPQNDPYGLNTTPEQQAGVDPRLMMPLVDMTVQQRMLEFQSAEAQRQAALAEYQTASSALEEFYSSHQEVEPQGELDTQIAQTIVAINEAWAPSGSTLDLTNSDIYDIAYEATKRPAFRQVLEINPALIDTDAGLELARRQAALLEADITPSAPAPTGATRTSQRKPVVERASSGTPPATEGTQLDEFEAAVQSFRSEREGKGSIFF